MINLGEQQACTVVQLSDFVENCHFCIPTIVNISIPPSPDPKTLYVNSEKNNVQIKLISIQRCFLVMMTLFMTSSMKNQFENDVITTDMKSARIRLLNYQSFNILNHFYF